MAQANGFINSPMPRGRKGKKQRKESRKTKPKSGSLPVSAGLAHELSPWGSANHAGWPRQSCNEHCVIRRWQTRSLGSELRTWKVCRKRETSIIGLLRLYYFIQILQIRSLGEWHDVQPRFPPLVAWPARLHMLDSGMAIEKLLHQSIETSRNLIHQARLMSGWDPGMRDFVPI